MYFKLKRIECSANIYYSSPVCVAKENILELHFSLFEVKTPSIYVIFHLHMEKKRSI